MGRLDLSRMLTEQGGIHTKYWLFIRILLFQSHNILPHPPTPIYSFIDTPGLCPLGMGNFPALGHPQMTSLGR